VEDTLSARASIVGRQPAGHPLLRINSLFKIILTRAKNGRRNLPDKKCLSDGFQDRALPEDLNT